MPHRAEDHETVLFCSPDLTIRRCSCGVVHLDLGPVSVRLEDAGFHGFAKACHQASARLALREWDGCVARLVGGAEH
ncbi:MAG: hypothetical protein H6741_34265 [Alphaproteobacteria bacterium]|nr:hypothetical protein [Alphaproteobacteria bacterium]